MATVPDEQTVQRSHHAQVAVAADDSTDAEAELYWQSTTEGNTVTTDKAVAADQEDIDTVIARVES